MPYTPEQMRKMADYLSINADPAAAMLRQGADAVEALAAIDAALARRPALADLSSRREQVERACSMAVRAESAEAALAAERAKVRELRAWLSDEIQSGDGAAVLALQRNDKDGALEFETESVAFHETLKTMDGLGLTGEEPR